MNRITFETSLLFAPLAYALHHIEEHIFFSFREWRTRYFPDNNQIPTEADGRTAQSDRSALVAGAFPGR